MIVGGPQYRVGSHRQYLLLARSLARTGIIVLRYDHRGVGDSDGEPRSFDSINDDIQAAIEYLQDRVPIDLSITLFGLCGAASACLMYAATDKSIHSLILLNPEIRDDQIEAKTEIRHYYFNRLRQRSFWKNVVTGKISFFRSIRDFCSSLRRSIPEFMSSSGNSALAYQDKMLSGLESFANPVLLLISGHDLTAKAFTDFCNSNSEWKAMLVKPNIQQIVIPNADHTLSSRSDLRIAATNCVSFLNQNIKKD
jgi:exosortase A-associated hydrolase 1